MVNILCVCSVCVHFRDNQFISLVLRSVVINFYFIFSTKVVHVCSVGPSESFRGTLSAPKLHSLGGEIVFRIRVNRSPLVVDRTGGRYGIACVMVIALIN